MPRLQIIPVAVTCLLLAACAGSSNTPADVTVQLTVVSGTPAPESATPATAAAATGNATSQSNGATPSASGTPQGTPGAILTPKAGAPADLETARRLESEGDLTAAAQAYIASANANAANKSEGTLGAARVLLELDQPSDVRALLEPFVSNATGRDAASHYMLARAYAALQLWSQSLDQYDAYIASQRAALPYAYLDRGNVLMQLNRQTDAIASFNKGLDLGVPPSAKRAYYLALAQANERAGSFMEAIRWYNQLKDSSDAAGDDALALSRIWNLKKQTGDPTWTVEHNKLLTEYPSTTQALSDLKDDLTAGNPIDPNVEGLIFYRNNDYTKAQPAFQQQITADPSGPDSAMAYYYLGAILESKGDLDGAATDYAKVGQLKHDSPLADDALWWRARLLEEAGKPEDARPLLGQIVSDYPESSWAADATFGRGMISYESGKYTDAASTWASSITPTTSDDEVERLTYWQAKALLKTGQKDAAKPILDKLASTDEDDYYGIRAVSLLANKPNLPKSTRESKIDLTASQDFATAESWLTMKTGRAISDQGWSTDNRWLRAQELWLVGRSSQGDNEVYDLISAYAQDPIAMYTLSRNLQSQGRAGMSGRAGQRLLRTLNTNPNQGLPKALSALSYPAAFGSFAQKYAQDEKISPLLLLAFVRQESFFDPRAESPAGALGLTQVLPDTAETVADKLGVKGTDDEDFLEADLNLRVGADYMADQLNKFNNEIFVAFAAYNAGPNGAQSWRKISGDDADVFLETIEFSETRLYVELVSENYAIYRYLYGGENVPDLPD